MRMFKMVHFVSGKQKQLAIPVNIQVGNYLLPTQVWTRLIANSLI